MPIVRTSWSVEIEKGIVIFDATGNCFLEDIDFCDRDIRHLIYQLFICIIVIETCRQKLYSSCDSGCLLNRESEDFGVYYFWYRDVFWGRYEVGKCSLQCFQYIFINDEIISSVRLQEPLLSVRSEDSGNAFLGLTTS